MLVEPEYAQMLLDKYNKSNYRKLDERLAVQYSRDMYVGNWHDTGDPIAINTNDILDNGQNRLRAVVIANKPIDLNVVFGTDPGLRDYYDLGRKRSITSVLKNHDFTNANVISSAMRLRIDVITHRQGRSAQGRNASFSEIRDMALDEVYLKWVLAEVINKNLVPKKLIPSSVTLYTYLELHKIDPYACAEFFHKLVTPENMTAENPIMVLHKRLTLANWTATGRLKRLQMVTVIFRAWNAWRLGEKKVQLKAISNDETRLVIPLPTSESVLVDDSNLS